MVALLAAGAAAQERDNTGNAPLHYAAANGHVAIVQALIAAGVGLHDKNKRGETPLCAAISGGHGAVVQALIAAGACSCSRDDSDMECIGEGMGSRAHQQNETVPQMLSEEIIKLQAKCALTTEALAELQTCHAALQQEKAELVKELNQARKDGMDRDAAAAVAMHDREAAYQRTIAELQQQIRERR